ncbi:hypothetical protein Tco_0325204 [Tanacetum coccineum]
MVHSLRTLSTLRRSGLRTASTVAKPCQGDSSEFYLITSTGIPVKEILLKLNLPDHWILKDGGEDALLKLFKITYQERYEHVGPNVASSQDGETRLCLVDDLKVFKITISHSRQDKGTSSSLKSMITTSNHKLMIKVKDYELKTKVKA